jgi:hypothetical protein
MPQLPSPYTNSMETRHNYLPLKKPISGLPSRATVAGGWNCSRNSNAMDMSISQDGNTLTRNIIDNKYPLLTKEQIVSNKENNAAAQNNFNMFTTLENSLVVDPRFKSVDGKKIFLMACSAQHTA